MPSFFASGLALLAAVSGVTANYGYGPAPTGASPAPYGNGTSPYHPHPTGYSSPDYYTTVVCETKTHYDNYHSVYYETIPLYTTSCPYTTKTYVSEECTYTTVVPVTTYYPPVATYIAPSGTGAVPAYPSYVTGAASALKVSGLMAVAGVMVLAAL